MERQLDTMQRSAITVMRVLLGILLAGILVLVGVAVANRSPEGNSQGEYYYFGAAVLLALMWLAGEFGRLRARERAMRERRNPTVEASWKPTFQVSRDEGPLPAEQGQGFQKTFELRFGTPPGSAGGDVTAPVPHGAKTFTFGRSFEVPLASLPADVAPDEATLDAMALSVRLGEDLDHVCEAVQPAYRHWSMMERRAYRFLIESKLAERARGEDAPPSP